MIGWPGPRADGVRHVVLDLRGLTFLDLTGLYERIRLGAWLPVCEESASAGPDAVEPPGPGCVS